MSEQKLEIPILHTPNSKNVLVGRGLGLGHKIGGAILNLSGAERPRVLIIPSPADTPESYAKYVAQATDVFGKQLGASIDVMHEFGVDPTIQEQDDRIGTADVVWITGGSTKNARDTFHRTGMDLRLQQASKQGKVTSGGSAGANLQATESLSWDTPVGRPDLNQFISIGGQGMLGEVRRFVGPHNDYIERDDGLVLPRSYYMRKHLEENPDKLSTPALGIDDAAALVFDGDRYQVLSAEDEHNSGLTVYRPSENGVIEQRVMPSSDYAPVSDIAV